MLGMNDAAILAELASDVLELHSRVMNMKVVREDFIHCAQDAVTF